MSKVVPSPPEEDLGGFGIPPEGQYVAALLAPTEVGLDEQEKQRREGMSDAELRQIPVKMVVLGASISRGENAGSRASLFCNLTRSKGQQNFLRFIANTGLAATIEQKHPDLGPIEQGWDDNVITSRRFFQELCDLFLGNEVNIDVKHDKSGNFANIAKVWPVAGGSTNAGSPPPSFSAGDWNL
jgi:hypothetical protein